MLSQEQPVVMGFWSILEAESTNAAPDPRQGLHTPRFLPWCWREGRGWTEAQGPAELAIQPTQCQG